MSSPHEQPKETDKDPKNFTFIKCLTTEEEICRHEIQRQKIIYMLNPRSNRDEHATNDCDESFNPMRHWIHPLMMLLPFSIGFYLIVFSGGTGKYLIKQYVLYVCLFVNL